MQRLLIRHFSLVLICFIILISSGCSKKGAPFKSEDVKRAKENKLPFAKRIGRKKDGGSSKKISLFKGNKKERAKKSAEKSAFSFKLGKKKKAKKEGDAFSKSEGKRSKRKSSGDSFSSGVKAKAYDQNKKKGLFAKIGRTLRANKEKKPGNDSFSSRRKERIYERNKKKGLFARIFKRNSNKEKGPGNDAFSSGYKEKAYEKNKDRKGLLGWLGFKRKGSGRTSGGNDHFAKQKYKAKKRKPEMGLFPKGMK